MPEFWCQISWNFGCPYRLYLIEFVGAVAVVLLDLVWFGTYLLNILLVAVCCGSLGACGKSVLILNR